MKIELGIHGIVVESDTDKLEKGSIVTISSDLHGDPEEGVDSLFDAAIDGLEALILAHACSGIDITTDDYKQGIKTALDAISDQYGD